MPESIDSALISALERLKHGEASLEDLRLISAAFASGQIEVIPTRDSKHIVQSGGANFGESNEIRVSGPVIGTQIIRGITAEQVKEIIEDTKAKSDDFLEVETAKINRVNFLKIGGSIIGLIVIVVIVALIVINPSAIFPNPLYHSGLITYMSKDENGKKNLHAIRRDGTDLTLIQGITDFKILAVSPDQRYMAIVLSQGGEFLENKFYPRFTRGSDMDLVVVSTDGKEQNQVLNDVSLVDAVYTPTGKLVVAVLKDTEINYTLTQTDGTNPHELYHSHNIFEVVPTEPPVITEVSDPEQVESIETTSVPQGEP